jgi:hypothetical protein
MHLATRRSTYVKKTPLLLIFLLLMASMSPKAATVDVKGTITLPYKGSLFSSAPSGAEKGGAMHDAKLQSWNLYTAQFNDAKMRQYLGVKEEFLSQIDNYVTNVRVIDESVDKDSKIITVAVRATINETAVNATLGAMSAAGQQGSGEGSLFTFIFVAREAVSAKTKDNKRIDVSQNQSASTATESLAGSGSSASSSSNVNTVNKSTTGGSTESTATQRKYQVTSSQDINANMSKILSTAGFEVVDYDDVVDACGGVERSVIGSEFGAEDDMSRSSRGSAIGASRDCDVTLFATGTIDIGVQDIDPVTGNRRVYTSVRAQVWDITRRLPRKVASVGPVQYAGLGPDDKVAMRNSLALAAEQAGREIVDQLNAKGIR